MTTHYETLSIKKNASNVDIKKAYKKLALQLHPDKNRYGDPAKFIAVQAAYDTLSDPDKRKKYDAELDSGNSEETLKEFYYSSPDDIYQKLPKIIADYTKRLKTDDLDILCLQHEFLEYILNVVFSKTLARVRVGDLALFDEENKKLYTSLNLLINKLKNKLLLKTKAQMLILQDFIQDSINADLQKAGVQTAKLFANKPLEMRPYCTPLQIELDIDNDTKIRNDSRIAFLTHTLQGCSAGGYLDIKTSSDDDTLKITVNVKANFFTKEHKYTDKDLLNPFESTPSREQVKSYKNDLVNYIKPRSNQKKYTGSRWGYSREEKVEAAQSLYDVLSGRMSPHAFFSASNKANLNALRQGTLKKVARNALQYAERELKPK